MITGVVTPQREAIVHIGVHVDAADTVPLVGMSLLDGYELIMQVTHGGDVRITALP